MKVKDWGPIFYMNPINDCIKNVKQTKCNMDCCNKKTVTTEIILQATCYESQEFEK